VKRPERRAPTYGGDGAAWVVSRASSPGAQELRQLLSRNALDHRWLDPDADPLVEMLDAREKLARPLPLVVLPDGSPIEPPAEYQDARPDLDEKGARRYQLTSRWRAEVAAGFGLPTRPRREQYDVLIVGAGPAGLTAAVYAASEGLSTLVLERMSPGGQAGTSARIENYPGFPQGISGAELAAGAYEQAVRFGAEILIGVGLLRVAPELETGTALVELVNGSRQRARTAVVAPGVAYRRLDAPGVEELIGRGVHYGSAPAEALRYRGRDVAVVGAANSSGQAALHVAEHARKVTVLVRGSSLEKSMSRYLVDRIEACDSIDVLLNSRVVLAEGADHLEALVVADTAAETEARLEVDALFVLVGGVPLTAGVAGWLRRDSDGFLMTGRDILEMDERSWWPLERDPYPLESSQPGVFVAGDVRPGSIKRVASAVGDGAMAVQLIHGYLSNPQASVGSGPRPAEQNILALAEPRERG
jgi:thioredoxin reductase (NADPH)